MDTIPFKIQLGKLQKFNLVHIGNFDVCANRYIDLFEKNQIKKIKIFIHRNKYFQIKDILNGLEVFKRDKIKKKLK